MKKINLTFWFFLLLVSAIACSNEEFVSVGETYPEGAYTRATVVLGHLNNDDAETRIKRLRVFVFEDSKLDTMLYKEFSENADSIVIRDLRLKVSPRKTFIAIANEPVDASDTYKNAVTKQAIYDETFSLADYLNADWTLDADNGCLPMFTEVVEKVPAGKEGQPQQNIILKLKRCVARIDLNMKKETEDINASLDGTFSIKLKNSAATGYLGQKTTEDILAVKTIQLNKDITLKTDPEKLITLYVPEMNKEKTAMELEIENVKIQDNYTGAASFVIGKKQGQIDRNTKYDITVTAKKAIDPFDVKMTVEDWTPVSIDGDIPGTYLVVNKMEMPVEVNAGGTVNVKTDATTIYVDWSEAPYLYLVNGDIRDLTATDVNVVDGEVDLIFKWQHTPDDGYTGNVKITADGITRVVTVTKKDGAFVVFDIKEMYVNGVLHNIPGSIDIIDIGLDATTFKFEVSTVVKWFITADYGRISVSMGMDDKEGELTLPADTSGPNSKGYYVRSLSVLVYYYTTSSSYYRHYLGYLNRMDGYWTVGDYEVVLGDDFNKGDYDNYANEARCPIGWALPTVSQLNKMTGVTLNSEFQEINPLPGFDTAFPGNNSYWMLMDGKKTFVTFKDNTAKIESDLTTAKLRCVRVKK